MRREFIFFATAMMIAGCSPQGGNQPPPAGANGSTKAFKLPPDPFGWPILDRTGKRVGTVFTRLDNGKITVTLDTLGLPQGLHGVHIHQVAKCEAPGFESAGGHWNWKHRKHGHRNPEGHHAGDLGNLTVAANSEGHATFVVAARDWDPKAAGGLPLVIHAAADDETTDPSGNSGERIACGILYLRRD